MLKTPRFFHVGGLAVLMALASLAACSGGCGNCDVPNFNGPPGATPAPFATPTPTPTPVPTIAPLSCSQNSESATTIVLGPALAPFALLAASTVTNVGNTLVTYTGTTHDDLIGVNSGTGPNGSETGFPPGTVTDGTNAIYASEYNTTVGPPQAAQLALTTAYNTAAGKAPTTTFTGGADLSASNSTVTNCGASGSLTCPTGTLGAGVYKSPSSLAIASANLTLDGGGNPQSIFIFQMVSTLTTTLNGSVGGNVILINGASPCNIYWQVGASATLGGATFYGNVLANTAITINATTFTGRALARTAAVSIPVAGGSLITNPGGS